MVDDNETSLDEDYEGDSGETGVSTDGDITKTKTGRI